MKQFPIYTEQTKCRDCYKCVRHCPVKAIKVENNSARIIHEKCIFCGKCVDACPSKAKKVRNDIDRAKQILKSGKRVILSLAPSWSTGIFGDFDEMSALFSRLGFNEISETALGASLISRESVCLLSETDETLLSTACPVVNEYIEKYCPDWLTRMTPLASPLQAHASWLKSLYGKNCKIIFAGPCIAKKREADNPRSDIDLALSFDEIKHWSEEESLPKDRIIEDFIPYRASESTYFAVEGGMKAAMQQMEIKEKKPLISLSGMELISSLFSMNDKVSPSFLELMACDGGCINGSGFKTGNCTLGGRINSIKDYSHKKNPVKNPWLPRHRITNLFGLKELSDEAPNFPESQVEAGFRELGKADKEDRLDCGGCGYNSCRDFTLAWLNGMGEKQMCVTQMRKRAQKKVDMLLETLPMGVAIINQDHKIAECNSEFLKLFTEIDFEPDHDFLKRTKGKRLERFVDLTSMLDQILAGEENHIQHRLQRDGQILSISLFTIEILNLAGILFQDITLRSLRSEVVIHKAQEVINKNLENVQKIASLLGENAAETEIILHSLTDEFHNTIEGRK